LGTSKPKNLNRITIISKGNQRSPIPLREENRNVNVNEIALLKVEQTAEMFKHRLKYSSNLL